jgi:hypothetical protein
MKQEKLLCPNCKKELYFNIDSYGRTPWHLHCENCDINIGSTSQSKAIDLIQTYHKPHTYIEYYNDKIQYIEETDE